ncbi:MAG: phosphatase [Bacteroidota bacterium]
MKLAGIDIGSNAIRLKIVNVIEQGEFDFFIKKLEYIRFPLRLGHDVFQNGFISEPKQEKFISLMHSFKNFVDLYETNDYFAVATSAFREAGNGKEIKERVFKDCDLSIQIIDGDREAELLSSAILPFLDNQVFLHIDVGGGSTELNLYHQKTKVRSRSFKIGSVRLLENKTDPSEWKLMKDWINKEVIRPFGSAQSIGTGGNINKVFELSRAIGSNSIPLEKVIEIQDMLNSYSPQERIFQLRLNPDRADVILPASDIYINVMRWCNSSNILVPQVGLMDGVINHLYHRIKEPV